MKFESQIFDEPALEFGNKFSHVDPRLGLIEAGPLQSEAGDTLKVGVVGSSDSIEKTQDFVAAAGQGFEGGSEKRDLVVLDKL